MKYVPGSIVGSGEFRCTAGVAVVVLGIGNGGVPERNCSLNASEAAVFGRFGSGGAMFAILGAFRLVFLEVGFRRFPSVPSIALSASASYALRVG